MRFQVNSKDMLNATIAAAAPISRGVIPVIECVLIRTDDRLTVTGTNLDTLVTASCDASITATGAWAVNADTLLQFLKSLGDMTLTVEGGETVTLTGGRAKLSLPAFVEGDFPQMVGADTPHEVEGGGDAITFCAAFASTEEAKYFLNGVCFSESGAVATDGHRLAVCPVTSPITAIVPNAAMRTISAVIKKGGRLFLGENAWRVESENIVSRGKLVEGTFPDWQRIMPRGDVFAEFDADDFAAAISTAIAGRAPNIFLRGDGETISINGSGAQNVDATADCPANVFAPFAGMLNAKYMLSACAALAGSKVNVAGCDGTLLLRPADRDGYKIIVMGMRHPDQDWPSARAAA